jgi:hypothetical protein
LDSVFTIDSTKYVVQKVDSVVYINQKFVLYQCTPNQNPLWIRQDVYINNHYPISPPTFGVATFDGADSSGMPYDWSVIPNYFPEGRADKLISNPINLSSLTKADSVYFSFYYQPQGRGANAPEPQDSLVLQFKKNDTLGTWQTMWFSGGYSLPDNNATSNAYKFKFVNIFVDSVFLYNNFQFRFYNCATLTGAVDMWHIDMVRLDKNRSRNDSIFSDAAFSYSYPSILRNYQSVPYTHYSAKKSLQFDMVSDTLYPFLHNQNNLQMNLTLRASVTKEGNPAELISPGSSNNVAPFTYCQVGKNCVSNGDNFNMNPITYEFPAGAANEDTAKFDFKIDITNINNDLITSNNTITTRQNFFNYYAYDDGTAENGYGLNVLDSKLAMRFKIYKPDTLRAVAMYFDPQTINFFSENNPYKFTLQVWVGSEYPEVLLYEKDSLQAKFGTYNFYSRINDFAYYLIDTTLVIDTGGYVFVGWKQQTVQILGLGFDRNINSNENMFYDIQDGNGWYQSQLPGSWMIRPCFGKKFTPPVGLNEPLAVSNFVIVPNPATESFSLYSANFFSGKSYQIQISDISGRVIKSEKNPENISISDITAGVYFVSVIENGGKQFAPQKLIVRK